MSVEPPAKLDCDSRSLVSQIVEHVKSQGIFDQFRRDCIEELEEKESYRQLKQRVESHVATFLSKQTWSDVLPKNQVRDSLRKHINQSEVLDRGVKQLISQALESKAKAFHTRIEGVVQNYMYMQSHPQRQDKHLRKYKTVETKEETRPSTSEVISDISQLIPVPSLSDSKAPESSGADKGKAGTQEGSKGTSSTKSMQQMKKSHSTHGKTGKGDESKTGGLTLRDIDPAEDNSRTKDGRSKAVRLKAESRDDHGRSSPKLDENVHKMLRDEKTKSSRVKMEKSFPSGGHSSSMTEDSGQTVNYQDEKTGPHKGIREGVVQSHCSSVGETDVSQGDVARLSRVKADKANETPSTVCSFLEYKVKVKDENVVPFKGKVKAESSKSDCLVHLHQEEAVESNLKCYDSEKGHGKKLCDEGISNIESGVQRSDDFVKTSLMEGNFEKVTEWRDIDVSHVSESQNSEKLAILKQTEIIGNLESKVENKPAGKREAESSGRIRSAPTSDPSRLKNTELPVARSEEELRSDKEERATAVARPMDEFQMQMMSDKQSLLPSHDEIEREAESVYEKTGQEVSSMLRDTAREVVSIGDYSDRESDISEVSSVHTSDLSSFDDELSSSSESCEERAYEMLGETEENEHGKNKDQEKSTVQSQSEQDSDAAPRRRSTRISSRRSTKEGESEVSEGEGRKIRTDSPRKRRHGEKRDRKPHPESAQRHCQSGRREKRGRGRPRKDNRSPSGSSSNQMRHSRTHQDGSGTAAEKSGSGTREDRTKRSQRKIKRTRCYSPSSEGTREVFLPRKRSRDGPN